MGQWHLENNILRQGNPSLFCLFPPHPPRPHCCHDQAGRLDPPALLTGTHPSRCTCHNECRITSIPSRRSTITNDQYNILIYCIFQRKPVVITRILYNFQAKQKKSFFLLSIFSSFTARDKALKRIHIAIYRISVIFLHLYEINPDNFNLGA